MKGKLMKWCANCLVKISEEAVALALQTVISFVATWCWNQTSVQRMRRCFTRLNIGIRWLKPRTHGSHNQLLKQLENKASEGLELLDGNPTSSNVQSAKKNFEEIRRITQNLKQLLKSQARESTTNLTKDDPNPVVVKVKPPQFNPLNICRPTRIQILFGRKIAPASEGN